MTNGSTVIPGLRYRDAHQAIAWLVEAFGFVAQAVYDGPDGTVAHAQLTLGGGMIMLGSVAVGAGAERQVQPDEVGGRETQTPYLIVADARAVCARVKAAGGEVIAEPVEMDYGGWGFGCRDLEGHLWSVGEYDPWAAQGS